MKSWVQIPRSHVKLDGVVCVFRPSAHTYDKMGSRYGTILRNSQARQPDMCSGKQSETLYQIRLKVKCNTWCCLLTCMFYVSHKCPHSNMWHTPNTNECMHVCSWVCIHNIGSQRRWDRGKEGSKNLEQRWFGWNRTSYSAEQFADSTAAHTEGSGGINW